MSRTLTEVRQMADVVIEKAKRLSIPGANRLRLKEGSGVYGQSWALVEVDPANGGQRTVAFFGTSREDAARGLQAFADGMDFAVGY